MAEKKNMFEQAAVKRQQEQKTIEAAVLGKPRRMIPGVPESAATMRRRSRYPSAERTRNV